MSENAKINKTINYDTVNYQQAVLEWNKKMDILDHQYTSNGKPIKCIPKKPKIEDFEIKKRGDYGSCDLSNDP